MVSGAHAASLSRGGEADLMELVPRGVLKPHWGRGCPGRGCDNAAPTCPQGSLACVFSGFCFFIVLLHSLPPSHFCFFLLRQPGKSTQRTVPSPNGPPQSRCFCRHTSNLTSARLPARKGSAGDFQTVTRRIQHLAEDACAAKGMGLRPATHFWSRHCLHCH